MQISEVLPYFHARIDPRVGPGRRKVIEFAYGSALLHANIQIRFMKCSFLKNNAHCEAN